MKTRFKSILAPCPECDKVGPHEVTEDNGGGTVWVWCDGCDTDFEIEL